MSSWALHQLETLQAGAMVDACCAGRVGVLWGEPSTDFRWLCLSNIPPYLLAPSCPELGARGCFSSCCWTSRGVGGELKKSPWVISCLGGSGKGEKATPHPFLCQKEKEGREIQNTEKPLNQPEPNNEECIFESFPSGGMGGP